MKKKFALMAASAATVAVMAGPAALAAAAHDVDASAKAHLRAKFSSDDFPDRGKTSGHFKAGLGGRGFGLRADAKLAAEAEADVLPDLRAAVKAREEAMLAAQKEKSAAMLAALEARKDAVLSAWDAEDKDARLEALAEARASFREAHVEAKTTFRAKMKAAIEAFVSVIKNLGSN